MTERSHFELNALIEAAKIGDIEEMCRLVEQGADLAAVDPRSREGQTAVHWLAISHGATKFLDFTEKYPATLGFENYAGKTPAMELAEQFYAREVISLACHPDYGEGVVTQVDNAGRTVPCYLVMRNDTRWVRTLMLFHEDVIKAQSCIIRTAIEEYLYHLVKPLYESGIALPKDFDDLLTKRGITRALIGVDA